MPATTRALLVALAIALIGVPAAAHASPRQTSTMSDDESLLRRGAAVRDRALTRMQEIGVDTVRVTVLWRDVAGDARSTRARRRRFDATRPGTYPTANWDRLDEVVRTAARVGLDVHLVVTPPAPAWARGRAPRGSSAAVRRAWRPHAGAFAKFVLAVGRRYSGRHPDENQGGDTLPRVSTWSLLNEPNRAAWLAPQSQRGRLRSPAIARELLLRGRAALDRSGHGRDTVLFGETAALGSGTRAPAQPVRPRAWLRALLCERPGDPTCNLFDKYGPLRVTAYAHHASGDGRSPARRPAAPDDVTMANVGALATLLDHLARDTRNVAAGLPVHVTEHGFETDPPDRFGDVGLERQAQWNVLAEFLAHEQPRVAAMGQSLLRDARPAPGRADDPASWTTSQSGLEFADGTPKPALQAYAFPFLARPEPGGRRVWGQLKLRPNDLPPGAKDTVQVQWSADGAAWRNVGAPIPVTSAMGFFTGSVAPPGPGLLRAVAVGLPVVSRSVGV